MKILYGIQGTGNGHISRANAMAAAFSRYPELEVDWLLSGRARDKGCGNINSFLWREGLTFVVKQGRIDMLATLRRNKPRTFLRDRRQLDLAPYDFLISDFEPVLCHAARKRGLPVTGIGHQYAFNHRIPTRGANPVARAIMRHYAPVTHAVGLHWNHFGQPILPPILDMSLPAVLPGEIPHKVLVYLPFEDPRKVDTLLQSFADFDFHIYHPELGNRDQGHMHYRALSREGFKQDLLEAGRVICNSGFELVSECLHVGKRILSKPLRGQMEQLSNARALAELGYAEIIEALDRKGIGQWLAREPQAVQVQYPDVAARLARWVDEGCPETTASLSAELWSQ